MCEKRDAFPDDSATCDKCGWTGDTGVCRACGAAGEFKDLGEFVVPPTAKEEERIEPVLLPWLRPVFAYHGLLGVDEDHKPTLQEIEAFFRLSGITRVSERWLWIHLFGVITSTRGIERQRAMDALTESK